jgi:hypothetical protein
MEVAEVNDGTPDNTVNMAKEYEKNILKHSKSLIKKTLVMVPAIMLT